MKQIEDYMKRRGRIIAALFDMFVLFAIIHILFVALLAIKNGDITYLNVFYIESASEIFRGIEKGVPSFILSIVIIAVVYLLFYGRRKD